MPSGKLRTLDERMQLAIDLAGQRTTASIFQIRSKVHMPETRFQKEFKARTGVTFKQYQIRIRANRAKLMLMGNYSLNAILVECRFKSRSNLRHAFMTTFGKSVKDVRKEVRDAVHTMPKAASGETYSEPNLPLVRVS